MDVSAPEQEKSFTRRDFLKLAGIAAVGLPLYAGEISRHEIGIERLTIRLPRLPEVFRGLTIAQISDFHYAQYTEAFFIKRVVEEVNRLKPDVVAFTGDYITHGFWSLRRKRSTLPTSVPRYYPGLRVRSATRCWAITTARLYRTRIR